MAIGSSRARAVAFALCLGGAAPAVAQDDSPVWTVFVQANPTQCWITATPNGTVATRGDQDVSNAISRDEALFYISFWPADERLAEVSYTGGYQFAVDSVVTVVIGDATFDLFTDGPTAWAGSPQDDARIIEAMRDATEAVVTATSTRGTQVVDTFSLQGFGAAMDDAQVRCTG